MRAFLSLLSFAAVLGLSALVGPAGAQPSPPAAGATATAVFAGGCFWSMETDFDSLPGILSTTDGYTGGHLANPTYEDVTTETTGHYESVRVTYDTRRLTYRQVLAFYWRHIDPTDSGGQFCDRGASYRTAIFVADETQRATALASKDSIERARVLDRPIATQILPLGPFWPAEEYHQNYHQKNPVHYGLYRAGCRRDAVVRQVWRRAPAGIPSSS